MVCTRARSTTAAAGAGALEYQRGHSRRHRDAASSEHFYRTIIMSAGSRIAMVWRQVGGQGGGQVVKGGERNEQLCGEGRGGEGSGGQGERGCRLHAGDGEGRRGQEVQGREGVGCEGFRGRRQMK